MVKAGYYRPAVNGFFAAVETGALSTWIREANTLWAFPFVLILHTVGLAFLVGVNVAVGARTLGVAAGVPLSSLSRFFPVMWLGFWVNAVSGVLLLIAYPTKALTNPLFYAKLVLIGAALALTVPVRRQMRRDSGNDPVSSPSIVPGRLKVLAVLSLACWAASITAGRFLAYTYTYLSYHELP